MAEDPHDEELFGTPHRQVDYRLIQVSEDAGVVRILLNRPPANVLSIEMMEEVNGALEALEYRRDVKLVVIGSTPAAGKYFCAGFEIPDHIGDRAYMMLEQFRRIFENLAKIEKPTLAVVGGAALGAGSMLAVGCDLVLAGASAKFGHPEIKAGVFNTGAAVLLARVVGRRKAFEMVLTGASVPAADAERIGLVTRVVPDDRLEAEAQALVQRFRESSAPVLQAARRALTGALGLDVADGFRHAEDVYLNQLMASEDAEEGLNAVLAKRKPVWKDR